MPEECDFTFYLPLPQRKTFETQSLKSKQVWESLMKCSWGMGKRRIKEDWDTSETISVWPLFSSLIEKSLPPQV